VQHVPQQRPKRYQRRQVGMGISRQTDPGARRPIEHPRRNLRPSLRVRSGEIAPEDHAIRPFDRSMKRDLKTRPRMKGVKHFPKLGPVGVLKPLCTTKCARIRASAISRRTSSRHDKSTQRPARQRARALRCAGLRALGPCITRSARSTCNKTRDARLVRRIQPGHTDGPYPGGHQSRLPGEDDGDRRAGDAIRTA
jgi:hypothetical protein